MLTTRPEWLDENMIRQTHRIQSERERVRYGSKSNADEVREKQEVRERLEVRKKQEVRERREALGV